MSPPRRALLSVTDKRGVAEFGRGLAALGFELISTGGTAVALREAGLAVTDVAELTGFPELLDGRLKTLHPLVHGGLLGDVRLPEHAAAMAEAGIGPIELLAVNLYAFEARVSGPHRLEEAIESIDIGGPAMARAAAKNAANVTVVVDPDDYAEALAAAAGAPAGAPVGGDLGPLRLRLAAKAFRHTAFYDSMIARYLTRAAGEPEQTETLTLGLRRVSAFRYGENPHQTGALYRDPLGGPGLASATRLWGLEPGYNNWLDADSALELAADLGAGAHGAACAIVKHGNPCGAAVASSLAEAFRLARAADPISAFGGVVAFDREVDDAAAEAMCERGNKLDVVVAPGFSAAALARFEGRAGWGQDVRLLEAPLPPSEGTLTLRTIRGGALVQTSDEDPGLEWRVAGAFEPTEAQLAALRFAWRIVPHVRSNAIVIATGDRLLGAGAGQMNRVQSVRLALAQAGETARGAALASDAFFPFADGVEAAIAAGIGAIVQPGGSKKDPEVVAAADAAGVPMVFTGARRFRH